MHLNLLVNPCSALVAILWFLVVIYIARWFAKSDSSPSFPSSPRMLLIVTRKRFTPSTSSCKIPNCVCLFYDVDPSTFTLIHQSLICSRWTFLFIPVFPCSLVVRMFYFWGFCFLLSYNPIKDFCCYFWYCIYFASLFSKAKLSVINFSPSPVSCLSSFQIFYRVYWLGLLVCSS